MLAVPSSSRCTLFNVHLHHVVTDITGETGMRITRDIVAGNHDPKLLAKHRNYRCNSTEEQIAEALRGEYRQDHLFLLRHALELHDAYGQKLAECDQVLETSLQQLVQTHCAEVQRPPLPSRKQAKRRPKEAQFNIREPLYYLVGVDLTAIPGLNGLSALQLVGEIGIDMARWPDPHHFVSWTTLAPSCRITGGKAKQTRRPASAHRVAEILRMAAMNAGRTASALGGSYRRLAVRAGKGKAIVALAAKLARTVYAMIRNGTAYQHADAGAYEARYRARVIRNLERRAKALGLQLAPATQPEQNPLLAGAVSQETSAVAVGDFGAQGVEHPGDFVDLGQEWRDHFLEEVAEVAREHRQVLGLGERALGHVEGNGEVGLALTFGPLGDVGRNRNRSPRSCETRPKRAGTASAPAGRFAAILSDREKAARERLESGPGVLERG